MKRELGKENHWRREHGDSREAKELLRPGERACDEGRVDSGGNRDGRRTKAQKGRLGGGARVNEKRKGKGAWGKQEYERRMRERRKGENGMQSHFGDVWRPKRQAWPGEFGVCALFFCFRGLNFFSPSTFSYSYLTLRTELCCLLQPVLSWFDGPDCNSRTASRLSLLLLDEVSENCKVLVGKAGRTATGMEKNN